jgi:RES domain-containing protein
MAARIHDRAILDALELIAEESVDARVWRVTRKSREPLRGSAAGGRWSPAGEFEVLYTSFERQGALAEIGYRLSLEPVWPSRLEYELHAFDVRTERSLRFADLDQLAQLGVDIARYQSFEYAATQAIAAAAHFLEFDGLIVPGARYDCFNFVLFLDFLGGDHIEVASTEAVDWTDWRQRRRSART